MNTFQFIVNESKGTHTFPEMVFANVFDISDQKHTEIGQILRVIRRNELKFENSRLKELSIFCLHAILQKMLFVVIFDAQVFEIGPSKGF